MSRLAHSDRPIPVIDLFAGPGGLAEGFASRPAFRIALSVEADAAAHSTLELRSFFRQFPRLEVPEDYYRHVRDDLTRADLFERYPLQARLARAEAWHAELGEVDPADVDRRIRVALKGEGRWVLCGGPPCQAYSVIGRSRRGVKPDDARLYLYREYLRILAEHEPEIFVLENVKGLLSSSVGTKQIFNQMLDDLRRPRKAVLGASGGRGYALFSLAAYPRGGWMLGEEPEFRPTDFIVKCEEYGIPQCRHRVIILGVREDLAPVQIPILPRHAGPPVPLESVLGGLPPLRSRLSRVKDGADAWREAICAMRNSGALGGVTPALKAEIDRALDQLRQPPAGSGGEFVDVPSGPVKLRPRWFRDPRLRGACNHKTRAHLCEDLQRYLFAACFAKLNARSPELRDFPERLLPKHKNVAVKEKELFFDDRFRVQMPDRPATTITSHLAKDGHYFIHYDETQCRSLTVREAARIQTFPDNYFFCGSRTEQYVQVGNAVPPLLAYQIANVAAKILEAQP